MNTFKITCISAVVITAAFLSGCKCQTANPKADPTPKISQSQTVDNLAVLWTSGDPAVAHKVCFMYTHAVQKQGWFDRVQLIVWGPSSKLLAEDSSLQAAVKAMIADGVELKACKACSDSYGVSEKLQQLDIEVKYMGRPLTEILKSPNWQVLTF